MDLPSLNALLRVNGLTPQSSPDDIRNALTKSGYSVTEIETAFELFHGTPLPATALPSAALAAYTAPTIEHTQSLSVEEVSMTMFSGRIGVLQFWLASLILIACSIVLLLLVEIIALPLFSIITGLSPFALPDLVMAPLHTLVLLCIGIVMASAPIAAFFVLFAGLQIRRYHDFGLSVKVWAVIILAEVVVRYVVAATSRIGALISLVLVVVTIVLLSWPGNKEENEWGSPFRCASLLAAIVGSPEKERIIVRGYRRVILPVVYVEAIGLLLAFTVSSILPRFSLPPLSAPSQAQSHATAQTKTSSALEASAFELQ